VTILWCGCEEWELESDIGSESEWETTTVWGKAAAESILAGTGSGEGKSCKIDDVMRERGYTSVESRIESVKACEVGAETGAGETKRRSSCGGAELDSIGVMLGGRGKNTSAKALILEGSCCLAWSFAGKELSSNTTFLERKTLSEVISRHL